MEKDTLKKLILEYQDLSQGISLVRREMEIAPTGNYVFVGLRRAGKSYLMYQCMQDLIAQGFDKHSFLYFNFEDDRVVDMKTEDLDKLKLAYEELYNLKPIFFLDEIQMVSRWETFARRLADTGYRVFITGSNAKMLSSEMATTLGGRYNIKEVFPFSFAEFLKAKGLSLPENWIYRTNTDIIRLFDAYFRMGGLPELCHIEERFKREYLSGVYNKIYFGDLLTRNAIRNDVALRLLVRKLAESVKQPQSFNRLAAIASTVNGKIKSSTVADYIQFMEEAYMIVPVENYRAKLADKVSNRKYYFIDNGLLNLFLMDPETSLLENIVAMQLRRLHADELTFYQQTIEVDFFLWETRIAYQVSYSLNDMETRKREINALLTLDRFIPLEKMYIITKEQEETISVDQHTIHVLPVWKWLLMEEGY